LTVRSLVPCTFHKRRIESFSRGACSACLQDDRTGCCVANQTIDRLRDNIRTVFLGHTRAVDLLLIGMLARGHVLIEDVPAVGKTVLAKSLAKSIDCKFTRIQLTPDLLPSDVLGVSIFNTQTQKFDFKPGPVFANIVLADEINRTTPRTQSALLEAMSEEQ